MKKLSVDGFRNWAGEEFTPVTIRCRSAAFVDWTIAEIFRPNIVFDLPIKGGKITKEIEYKKNEVDYDIDFDGDVEFITGKFRKVKGAPYFRPSKDKRAPHVLLKVRWGSGDRTSGVTEETAQEKGAIFFEKRPSATGRGGFDYWVLPNPT